MIRIFWHLTFFFFLLLHIILNLSLIIPLAVWFIRFVACLIYAIGEFNDDIKRIEIEEKRDLNTAEIDYSSRGLASSGMCHSEKRYIRKDFEIIKKKRKRQRNLDVINAFLMKATID